MSTFRRARTRCSCGRDVVRETKDPKPSSVEAECPCGRVFTMPLDATWWISYRAKGRTHRKRIGPDRKLALAVERKTLTDIARGVFLEPEAECTTRLRELAADYWKHLRVTRRRPEVVDKEERAVEPLLAHLGDVVLTDIKTGDVDAWCQSEAARGIKPSTVQRRVAILSGMLSFGVRTEKLKVKPRMPALHFDNAVEHFVTRDQARAILSQIVNLVFRDAVELLLCTGLRRGEVLGLTWAMVDGTRRMLNLPPELCKSNKGRRVPLNDAAVAVLERRKMDYREDLPWVFTFRRDQVSGSSLSGTFARAASDAGMPEVRLHDCRHSFASALVQAGVDLLTVATILGHQDLAQTRRYSHLAPDGLARAAANADFGAHRPTVHHGETSQIPAEQTDAVSGA